MKTKKSASSSSSSSSSSNKAPGLRRLSGKKFFFNKLKEKLNWTQRGNLPGDKKVFLGEDIRLKESKLGTRRGSPKG